MIYSSQSRSRGVNLMEYNAWFQCINPQCKATYPLNKIIYRCESCSSLLEVRHDMKALAQLDAKAWMKLFEDRYKSNQWPYGSGVWGKKEWILPNISERQHRLALRGRHQPLLGGTVRQDHRPRKHLDQALRQLPQRVVQGPRHDRARLAGQADDQRRRADPGRRLRLDGRHLGGPGGLLRRGRHPLDRAAAQGQDLHRPARPAHRERRPRAVARHGLRRLHAAGAGDHQGRNPLPGQLHELAADRGAEDRRHRDRPAVRLEGAGRHRHPRREPGQRLRPRERAAHDEGPRDDRQAAADRRGPGAARQPALPLLPQEIRILRAGAGRKDAGERHPDRQPGERGEGDPHAEAVRRRRHGRHGAGAGRRGRAGRPDRACSPARTRVSRWPR